jgi:hypothetical protein
MWDKFLELVYDRAAGEALIGTALALHDVGDKPLDLGVDKAPPPPQPSCPYLKKLLKGISTYKAASHIKAQFSGSY